MILGANGAGKSTLLRAIAGICEGKVAGEVRLGADALTGLSPDEIVEKGVVLVPEGRGIFGDLSVKENLLLGAYPARARDSERENLDRVLDLFPTLQERHGQVARTMSGGEQQMLAIGRAMMSAPEILMLDEPSLGPVAPALQGAVPEPRPGKVARHRGAACRAKRKAEPGNRGSGIPVGEHADRP